MMALTKLTLPKLPRQPYGCAEAVITWRYLVTAHKTVSGLFDALHVLRQEEQRTKNSSTRGRLSQDQQDQLRAALVFTSSGLDACLTKLLRDTVPVLVDGNDLAERSYRRWIGRQLDEEISIAMRQAIIDRSPRERMVELYVGEISRPSLQGTNDIMKVRDALGISHHQMADEEVDKLKSFFAARNEIVHQIDLLDSTGAKTARRARNMIAVRDQCGQVLQLLATIITATVENLRACREIATKH